MSKILLIDGQNNIYRAASSYAKLKSKGRDVSCLFGFVKMLEALIRKFKPDDIYIAWDGKKSKIRLKLHPDYKSKRKVLDNPIREQVIAQRPLLMDLLYNLGIKQCYHEDFEGDDHLYITYRYLRKTNPDARFIIVSRDKDFHQLINKKVQQYDYSTSELITHLNLKSKFGYTPKQCVDYLSLVGDSSDNIPGVRGIGPAKASKFLEEYNSIKDYLGIKTNGVFKKSPENIRAIEKARMLIDLRLFYKTHLSGLSKPYPYKNFEPKFRKSNVNDLAIEYDINTFRTPKFIKLFKTWNTK